MKKLTKQFFITALSLLLFSTIRAQSLDLVKTQMVKDWERAKAYTMEYLNTMPADKYSFKATDSVRSFAQQMLHLATANGFFMSTVAGTKPPAGIDFGLERRSTAQNKDSVVSYVMASYDYAINTVKNSDVSKWGEAKKFANRFDETNFSLMNKCFEHQTHHRGQTTIYIRLVGVKPPNERLFDQ